MLYNELLSVSIFFSQTFAFIFLIFMLSLLRGDNMSVGSNIKRYRYKAKMSQRELGDKLGITQQQIAQYENEKRKPKLETINKIASALGCSVSELEDNILDVDVNCHINHKPVIKNGFLSSEVKDIDKFLEEIEDLPFNIMTESERLIVFFNSLNDLGKDRALEYMSLLLSSAKYRNTEIHFEESPLFPEAHVQTDTGSTPEADQHDPTE